MYRFRPWVARLYTVMDKQLAKAEYLVGGYNYRQPPGLSVARGWRGMAGRGEHLNDYPNVKRRFEPLGECPA